MSRTRRSKSRASRVGERRAAEARLEIHRTSAPATSSAERVAARPQVLGVPQRRSGRARGDALRLQRRLERAVERGRGLACARRAALLARGLRRGVSACRRRRFHASTPASRATSSAAGNDRPARESRERSLVDARARCAAARNARLTSSKRRTCLRRS